MKLYKKIVKSTCRVVVDRQTVGTAFLISNSSLLTAYHIVERSNKGVINLYFDGINYPIPAKVQKFDVGADLAKIQILGNVTMDREVFEISSVIPSMGEPLLWGGYAILFGEPLVNRIRIGRGIIASRPFQRDSGIFFEVDGIFNPGHSGAPIIHQESEKVVGVVSASAGNVQPLIQEWNNKLHKMQRFVGLARATVGLMATDITFYKEEVAQEFVQEFRRYGVEVSPPQKTDKGYCIQLQISAPLLVISFLLLEIASALVITADNTFQMGLGIGSGGNPLLEIVSP